MMNHLSFECFYLHSPCGERPEQVQLLPGAQYFNPRSPCGERRQGKAKLLLELLFQSTLPVRGATGVLAVQFHGSCISIHAPHAGSD